MKLWDFKKIHAKGWKIGSDHVLEVQIDRWSGAPLLGINVVRTTKEHDHPGWRLAVNLLRWEFSVELASVHHAEHFK